MDEIGRYLMPARLFIGLLQTTAIETGGGYGVVGVVGD